MECYAAYKAGRAENDPSANWYEGELGFFDYYIVSSFCSCLRCCFVFSNPCRVVVLQIPLAKKLKECGVFGVSSGEYLDYARKNRQEWE